MKAIKLVHFSSSLQIGGAEAILYDLITHLNKPPFKHVVITVHNGPYSERLRSQGIPVFQVRGLLFRYDFLFWIRLWLLLRRLRPDCLHTLLWSANVTGRIMGWLLGIPTVSAVHNNVDQDGRLRNMFDMLTMRLSKKIIAVSPGVADSLRTRWAGARSLEVIPNGINAQEILDQGERYKKSRYELGLADEHFVIGSVGRFHPIKRYDLLLESFAMVNLHQPLSRLVLVGAGPQEGALRARASKLGIEQDVIFVVGHEAYGYYSLFDCFVLTSDKEGISLALLEAMNFALPCVVTHQETHHPVLHNGYNGLMVEAGNGRLLAKALIRLIEDGCLRRRLGECARQTVAQSFTSERMVKAYADIFVSLSSGD